ncbi:hypothetical protein EMIT0194P_90002 [Pseudomonas serbica]
MTAALNAWRSSRTRMRNGSKSFSLHPFNAPRMIVPTLCVVTPPVTLCVTLLGRGASRAAFPAPE